MFSSSYLTRMSASECLFVHAENELVRYANCFAITL